MRPYEVDVPIVLKCTVFAGDILQAEQRALREARCFLAYAGAHDWETVREDHDNPEAIVGELTTGWAAGG